MDDQFLHRMRREPPAGFAIRLKRQLDRSAVARPWKIHLILGLAIFGTAFALVSPPARRAFVNLFAATVTNQQPQAGGMTVNDASAAAGTQGAAAALTATSGSALARHPLMPPAVAVRAPAPVPQTADVQPAADAADPVAATSAVPVTTMVGSVQGMSRKQTVAAVATRQGLFKVLGWVTLPAISMLQGGAAVDAGVARVSAARLQQLSPLIPEVFRIDTRPFAVNTRALDSIWTAPADFRAKADDLTDAAGALAAAAASGDEAATLDAVRRVAKACSACHDRYRQN